MERHRPGPLKQQNKRHNSGKHRTKGQLEKVQKGILLDSSYDHSRERKGETVWSQKTFFSVCDHLLRTKFSCIF